MCQYGARLLATRGKTWREILAHYYGGIVPDGPRASGPEAAGGGGEAVAQYPEQHASPRERVGSVPAIRAYTWDGQPTTVAALQAKYKFVIRRAEELGRVDAGDEVFRVVALREKAGDTAIIVRSTRDSAEAPLANAEPRQRRPDVGQKVAGHWPDAAPQSLPGQWHANYVIGETNANGEVTAVTMGPGGVIHENGGPHAVWMIANSALSDCVDRLGWDGATDHRHVNVEFALVVQAAAAEAPTTPSGGASPETPAGTAPASGAC